MVGRVGCDRYGGQGTVISATPELIIETSNNINSNKTMIKGRSRRWR